MTSSGARCEATTTAPSAAWPITPIGSSAPSAARCQRKGRRRHARSEAAITARPTKPVSSRLPYSMTALMSAGGTVPP